jgi:predicted ATP-grasp superfamily ATP-dependent carboligase
MKVIKEIEFSSPPVMLAAWPGMGNVGLIAMDYLRRKMGAELLAEIDMSPFFIPESIIVKDGIAQLPEIPSSVFHCTKNPNLIIFESNAQISGKDGITLIKNILDLARQYNVSRIFTAAALAQPMSFQAVSDVLASCSSSAYLDAIKHAGIVPMPDGYIAGLNGLLLGVAASRGLDAACLLATMPSYAANMPYPKASLEIVKLFNRLLFINVDLDELNATVEEMNQQLSAIEERIRQLFPVEKEADEEMPEDLDEEKVPHYIMEKIEKLFAKVGRDHSAAPELKRELDKWNLYKLYENRFLDLFEDGKDKP